MAEEKLNEEDRIKQIAAMAGGYPETERRAPYRRPLSWWELQVIALKRLIGR